MEITEDQFMQFEKIRRSGICNMFDTATIKSVTDLKDEEISTIRRNYSDLAGKYLQTESK